ncbi:MAG: replication initiation protein [Lachnospiraceae bacterium]|nr:replication initiation protein [Lachnospiraceae bacterium]
MGKRTSKDETMTIEPNEFSKSNFLISSKYRSSLLENQIMAISLSRIQTDGILVYAEIKASELKKMLNITGGSFYAKLDKTANMMTGKTIGFTDPDNEEFEYHAVVTSAKYKRGTFRVEFNHNLKNMISDIKNNFTRLSLPILMQFKTVYGFRLYEVLKSRLYKGDMIVIRLSELRFLLGVANAELENVKSILRGNKNPDYDKALKLSPEKIYDRFHDFSDYVLEPAIKDINTYSDIHVSYTVQRAGQGGKIFQITFLVTENDSIIVDNEMIEEKYIDKDSVLEEIHDLIEEKLKLKDYSTIAEAANYDIDRIKKAYCILKQNSNVENVVGFMIKAIEDNYEEPVKAKKTKSTKKANSFNNFEQQNIYDFEELEKALLSNK